MLIDIKDIVKIESPRKKEHILAFRSDFVNLVLKNHNIDIDCTHALVEDVDLERDFPNESVFLGMRESLEQIPFFRHPIFYITLEHKGKIALYQRLNSGGDSRLHNMHSVGFGGHVDLADTIHDNSVVDAKSTIELSAARELSEELSLPFDINDAEIKTRGYIVDNRDEVGKVHLGVWQSLIIPDDIDVSMIDISDDEKHKMEFLGFFDLEWYKDKLENDPDFEIEGWSEIIVNR
jgi:predicted NUDIX family phosphoesterase